MCNASVCPLFLNGEGVFCVHGNGGIPCRGDRPRSPACYATAHAHGRSRAIAPTGTAFFRCRTRPPDAPRIARKTHHCVRAAARRVAAPYMDSRATAFENNIFQFLISCTSPLRNPPATAVALPPLASNVNNLSSKVGFEVMVGSVSGFEVSRERTARSYRRNFTGHGFDNPLHLQV